MQMAFKNLVSNLAAEIYRILITRWFKYDQD